MTHTRGTAGHQGPACTKCLTGTRAGYRSYTQLPARNIGFLPATQAPPLLPKVQHTHHDASPATQAKDRQKPGPLTSHTHVLSKSSGQRLPGLLGAPSAHT